MSPATTAAAMSGATRAIVIVHMFGKRADTAGLLLNAGADANTANDFRMTPLSEACTNGSAAFVRLLLKSGANKNLHNREGETASAIATKRNFPEIAKLLG